LGAAVTAAVLVAGLITGSAWLLAWQTLAFALGAAVGVGRSPYGWLFRKAVRPRLGPPPEFESPQPPRFAQAVGLLFAGAGLAGFTLGPQWPGLAATGAAPAAAFLNAAFGYCLGCEMYLLGRRATVRAGQ
jgi:FtsH-binding integral membrane protein